MSSARWFEFNGQAHAAVSGNKGACGLTLLQDTDQWQTDDGEYPENLCKRCLIWVGMAEMRIETRDDAYGRGFNPIEPRGTYDDALGEAVE